MPDTPASGGRYHRESPDTEPVRVEEPAPPAEAVPEPVPARHRRTDPETN